MVGVNQHFDHKLESDYLGLGLSSLLGQSLYYGYCFQINLWLEKNDGDENFYVQLITLDRL